MNQLAKKAQKIFVDAVKVRVLGGTGGNGLPQYGGIGGKGGDVYIQGSSSKVRLDRLMKGKNDGTFKAGDGADARRTRLIGQPGTDLIIKVPLGVTIKDINQTHLGEIDKQGDKILVAYGGRGGDKFNDNHGFVGQKRILRLDLKTISDSVFVGFPNAGKSTLLRAVSRATPRVAEYPFTTLRPYLGIVNYGDFRTITMTDLPGLVEGAHKNLGLGHDFLKHMVRTKMLIFVIDINDIDLGETYAHRSPIETLCILVREIELYDDTILNKPSMIVVSKMDSLPDSQERFHKFKMDLEKSKTDLSFIDENIRPERMIEFEDVLPICSKSGYNIEQLKSVTRDVLDKYAEIERQKDIDANSFKELQPLENNRLIQR